MKVEITGRHIVITPAIHAYVLKKLGKFTKILGEDINFHVIIEVEKERQKAEILLKSKMLDLAGKGESDDLYKSIMRAIEKLERQALKYKEKRIGGKRQKIGVKSVASEIAEEKPEEPPAAKKKSPKVREESAPKKLMTVEEATITLEESEYPFVAFRNVEGGDLNVLYRRKGGSLRLIRG